MRVFATTPEEKVEVYKIATELAADQQPVEFILAAVKLAEVDQGFYGLMKLWLESADDPGEREELLHAMQEELDDEAADEEEPGASLYTDCEGLGELAQRVLVFKARLKDIIDRDHGGVTQAAAKIGMPQPSLSRFLKSPAPPRRTTLYKIARKLGLPEAELAPLIRPR